jgi:hypothetical protein
MKATIWYQLVRAGGDEMGSVDKVKLFNGSDIADFRKRVKDENSDGLLRGISPAELKVYRNKEEFESKISLEEDLAVSGLGQRKANALYVAVPEQASQAEAADQNPLHMLQIEENKLQILKLEEINNKLQEKSAKLEETVNNYIRKAQTVAISALDIETIEEDGYVCEAKAVDTPTKIDFAIPGKFQWPVPDKESDISNTDAYLKYLEEIAREFDKLKVEKSIESPHLNTTVGINPHHLNGKADIYVMPSACQFISRNQLAMVFEMKPKKITSNNVAQSIGYVIAANSLFDIPGRPSPVGVLSDFIDQWVLIWIGADSEICYAAREKDSDGKEKDLTRETAIYYIRKHLNYYNQLLLNEGKLKRKADVFNLVFDGFEAGVLKKYRVSQAEDNMRDLLETDEEVALYNMRQRLRMTPLFEIPTAVENDLSYFS